MSGRTEYSFVEVVMQTYEPGDRVWSSVLEDYNLIDADLQDVTEEIPEVIAAKAENKSREAAALSEGNMTWLINSKAYEADLIVTQPFTVWEFNCFGQNFAEGTSSGIEHEIQQMDLNYVFKAYLEELKQIGQQLIKADRKHPRNNLRPVGYDYKFVRFVTLWSYRSYEDTYTHEWDSEWALEGFVEPDLIGKLLSLYPTQDSSTVLKELIG